MSALSADIAHTRRQLVKRIAVIVNFVTLFSEHHDKNLEKMREKSDSKNVAVCKEINLCWLTLALATPYLSKGYLGDPIDF